VFLHRLAGLVGEHPGEVDPGGQALLPPCTYHTRWKQKGFARGLEHDQGAEQDEAGARQAGGGPRHGGEDQCLRLPRVLGQEQGGGEGGVRNRYQGRATGPTEEKKEVFSTVGTPSPDIHRLP